MMESLVPQTAQRPPGWKPYPLQPSAFLPLKDNPVCLASLVHGCLLYESIQNGHSLFCYPFIIIVVVVVAIICVCDECRSVVPSHQGMDVKDREQLCGEGVGWREEG